MHNFKNGHLVVNGQTVNELDFAAFEKNEHMGAWSDAFWKAASAADNAGSLQDVVKSTQILADGSERKFFTRVEVLGSQFETLWEHTLSRIAHIRQMASPVEVDGVAYCIIKYFSVYHSGWDCDTIGFIVKTETGPKLVLSSHGKNYFGQTSEIESFISEYQKAISEMSDALSLLVEAA